MFNFCHLQEVLKKFRYRFLGKAGSYFSNPFSNSKLQPYPRHIAITNAHLETQNNNARSNTMYITQKLQYYDIGCSLE